MSEKCSFLLVFVVAGLCLISCGQPATEEIPAKPESETAAGETGPDSTVVDPDHYTVDFENDRVRVVRIKYGPGEDSVMHHHPDSATVFLTDYSVEMTLPDGSTSEMTGMAGTTAFAPGGQHHPKNLSDAPLEVVQVELKAEAAGTDIPEGEDPTVVDAAHYTAEFENDQVRILRIAYGPGEESVMHDHRDGVAVFLTDHLVQMTLPDGSTSRIEAEAGETLWAPAGPHLPKNVADGPWELVLVELK
jgi:quercetin dioxygenase-like cupin family protein